MFNAHPSFIIIRNQELKFNEKEKSGLFSGGRDHTVQTHLELRKSARIPL
jgi:hypothetical protein